MPRPLTLYKDGRVAHNVYPSELAAWQSQGWSPEKEKASPAIPTAIKVAPEPAEPISREAELQAMDWREVKAIAEALGIDKNEGQSWDDMIPVILEKEGN